MSPIIALVVTILRRRRYQGAGSADLCGAVYGSALQRGRPERTVAFATCSAPL